VPPDENGADITLPPGAFEYHEAASPLLQRLLRVIIADQQ
jgi:hypothetical protein